MPDIDRRRLMAGTAGTLLLSLAPWHAASGARLIDVRMWPAEEYTRVTIEYDTPLKFKYFFIRSTRPLRFVVDIEGLELTPKLKQQIAAVKPDDPYIQAIRVAQYLPRVVRLVMDLKTDVKPEVFQLKPYGDYQYRLVFDIYPKTPKDEIGKLLAQDDDPLKSLLAGLEKEPQTAKPAQPPKQEKPREVAEKLPPKKVVPEKKPVPQKAHDEKFIVIIDPGHGGEDPGAIGRRGNREKTVVLQIARRLVKLINGDPKMAAVMTRNSDHFVSLGGRVKIAQKKQAHLLVSIHADAWIKPTARGSSVFALSVRGASSAAARWLAKKQNESDLIGGVSMNELRKDVAVNVVDLSRDWTIGYSLALGASILREMKSVNRLHKATVEQAGFAVLKGQGIPSVLVETAFISNPEEERLLITHRHQQKVAEAIFRGIKKQMLADTSWKH